MKKLFAIAFIVCGVSSIGNTDDKPLTDAEIRKILIQQSIANYPGNCPCPYNLASNGSRCGKRSAYSKPGGYSPLCYPADVSDKTVEDFRKQVERE